MRVVWPPAHNAEMRDMVIVVSDLWSSVRYHSGQNVSGVVISTSRRDDTGQSNVSDFRSKLPDHQSSNLIDMVLMYQLKIWCFE